MKSSFIRGCFGIAGPITGLQTSQAMSVISGTEATYLVEARLNLTFTGELKPFIGLLHTWHQRGAQQHTDSVTEELKCASRKVGGYWRRSADATPAVIPKACMQYFYGNPALLMSTGAFASSTNH